MKDLSIINYNGKHVTESTEVSLVTDIRHDDLLKKIRGYVEILDKNNEDSEKLPSHDFFISSTYINSQNKEQPCYLLTRKGCDMVANKMTGEKGVLFTAAYVTKFEEMERQTKQLTPLEQLRLQYQVINEHEQKLSIIESKVINLENTMTIDYSQQEELNQIAKRVVTDVLVYGSPAYKELSKKAFSQIWKDFKRIMQVNSYRNTAVADYQKAKDFLNSWKPQRELELMIKGANSQMSITEGAV